MAEIKKLTLNEFKDIASQHNFNEIVLGKDYRLTLILYLIKGIGGMYFKGGTALQKIFLNYSRLSEDADFTLTKNIEEVKRKIVNTLEESGLFEKITKDKDVKGFTRLVVHYKGFSNEDGSVFIDLNERAKLLMKPEKHAMRHFYKNHIPEFSLSTLAKEEMVAEKVAAAIGRNQPRDHYDIYRILREKIPINVEMVKEKCKQSNVEFDIAKIFNKAKKLKNRWNEDLLPLLSEEVSFQEVITTLAKHFKLKEEKDKRRN
ncbi:nucleotidyl transferase AbiEii/AbiGii toxin family protein [Candidatus Woesearchaeota archaeon]|nr:nucleotidyl transferase AbiEii/AbiGii toxin family protein [Candidatus Woesearchaeota archaeon]